MSTDFYTPQPEWAVRQYGYLSGHTYWINGHRMYLANGYWYFVDQPDQLPLRASRPHYRSGGIPGIFFKVLALPILLLGISMLTIETPEMIAFGAVLLLTGAFGVGMILVDSIRNHPGAWKVFAVATAAVIVIHGASTIVDAVTGEDG